MGAELAAIPCRQVPEAAMQATAGEKLSRTTLRCRPCLQDVPAGAVVACSGSNQLIAD